MFSDSWLCKLVAVGSGTETSEKPYLDYGCRDLISPFALVPQSQLFFPFAFNLPVLPSASLILSQCQLLEKALSLYKYKLKEFRSSYLMLNGLVYRMSASS